MTSRTKRFSALALVLATVIGMGAYTVSVKAEAADSKPAGKTLKQVVDSSAVYATYDGGQVTGKDVLDFMSKLPPALQSAPDQLLPLIVNQMVNDKLVAKEAMDQKLDQDSEVQARIAAAKEQAIRDAYVEKQLDGKITDSKLKAKYDELVKNAPPAEEVHAKHILVSDEKTAQDVIAKLNKGGNFAELAKQYSIDPSKDQGGDLGYVTKDQMVKEFGDALFSMKKGEISKTPVKTQFGYHVIKVEDRRTKAKPTFDQVKETLRKQMTDEEVRNVVKGLREKNNVKVTIPGAAEPAAAAPAKAPAAKK